MACRNEEIGVLKYKNYKCSRCGNEKRMSSSHYNNLRSWGQMNRCQKCKASGLPTIWVCLTEEKK